MKNQTTRRASDPSAAAGAVRSMLVCGAFLFATSLLAQNHSAGRSAGAPHSYAFPASAPHTAAAPVPREQHQAAPIVRESPPAAPAERRFAPTQISQSSPLPRPGSQPATSPGAQPREESQQRGNQPFVRPGHPMRNQIHLNEWMDSHRSLPLDQQQRALQQEPGFNNLNPELQQRMHNRLSQLNTMAPEKRQRVIARTEAMERLNPAQRQQVTSAMQQLGTLPEDRRMIVGRAFHAGLEMPEPQRQAWLNSPQTRSQFSDQERATLGSLFTVAPVAAQAGFPAFQPRRQQQPAPYPPQP